MKRAVRPIVLVLAITAIAAVSAAVLLAQSTDEAIHAPSGGVRTTVISISVPPLPGAPFTAVVTTEWKRILEDGSTVTIGNRRTIARDNSGRIFQERRSLYPAGDPHENDLNRLEFADPGAHTLTTCWPQAQLCQVTNYYRSADDPPPAPAGLVDDGKAFLTRLNLGRDLIAGVEAIGTRETTTFNAGAFGNDRPTNVVKEFWYSQQLGINLIEKRQDPRYGAQTFRVDPITLGEPDASLFDLPAGFRVEDKRPPAQ